MPFLRSKTSAGMPVCSTRSAVVSIRSGKYVPMPMIPMETVMTENTCRMLIVKCPEYAHFNTKRALCLLSAHVDSVSIPDARKLQRNTPGFSRFPTNIADPRPFQAFFRYPYCVFREKRSYTLQLFCGTSSTLCAAPRPAKHRTSDPIRMLLKQPIEWMDYATQNRIFVS